MLLLEKSARRGGRQTFDIKWKVVSLTILCWSPLKEEILKSFI